VEKEGLVLNLVFRDRGVLAVRGVAVIPFGIRPIVRPRIALILFSVRSLGLGGRRDNIARAHPAPAAAS
jgi:hypothetical protein